MSRRANRPTNDNYQDYLIDFNNVDFSQYGEVQTPQIASKEEPGFWEKAYNSGGALLEGLTYVPGDVWDTIKNAWNGGEIDVTDRNAIEERRRRDAEKQAYQQKWEGKTFEGLTDAMNSIGYSVGTMGASLGAGLAAAPAGPVAAGAAALGASGTLAYRATKDDFMHRLYDETEKTLGREPTQEEWNRVANEFDSEATRYGLWEAGPEALSNLFMGKLLGPLGKGLFKSGVGGFVKRTLGMAGEELGTETATQMGQGKVEAELGWRDEAPGVKEAFLEVAPATLWQMGLMAGGKKAADIAYNRLSKRKEAVENNIDETQHETPEQPQPQQQTLQALPEGSQAPLELPAGQNIEMGWEGTGYGPIAPDAISPETQAGLYGAWDNLNGQQQAPQQEIAPQVRQGLFGAWDDYAQSQQPQQAEKQILYRPQREGLFGAWDQMFPQPIQPSIQEQMNSGETVDLLNPQEAQPQSGPTPEIEQAPMVAEQEQVAPPQIQPQNQIAQQPIQPVSPEGIMGGVPGFQETPVPQVAPQAIPTQSAITNTQQTPRADTQAQAAQLGMPSPQAVPQAALPEQQLPQLPQLSQAQTAPQSPLAGLSVMQDSGLQASPMPAPTSNGIGTAIELPANEGVENAGQEETSEQGTPGLQQRDGGSDVQLPDGNEGRPAEGRTGESSERPSAQQGEGRNKRKLKIPNRPDEGVSFEIREADDVQASHLPEAGFQKNPRYQLENERRYHDEPASRDDVLDHAKDLDPDMLMESIDASQGAPIIDRQGNVLGGNSRAMSIRHAYEKFPQRAEAYRQALKERAESLGIDPAQIDKMKRPMLVRSMDRDMDAQERQSMVSALNDTFTKSKDKRASGKSRGDRLSPRTLDALGRGIQEADSLREFFDQSESASVVEMLIKDGVIQSTERTALVAEDGLLNPDGKKIVEEALRGRVAKSYEALDALPAAVVGKIDAAIPYVLIAENIGQEWNITPHMQDAVDLVAEYQASKSDTPQAFLKQLDMTKGGKAPSERYSPQAQTLFLMMLDAKKKEFAKAFERFAAQAKLSQGGLGVGLENDVAFDESFDGKRREELIDMLPKEEVYNARRKMTNQQIKERLKEIQREKINKYTQEKETAQARQDVDQSPDSETSPNQASVDEQHTPSNSETDNYLITDEGQINRDYGTIENPNTVALGDYFAEQFEAGKRYDNIGQARREAGQLLHGKNNIPPAQFKAIDEAIELGVVKTVRKTVADMRKDSKNDKEIFKALVDLYQRQPNLSTRTSTSVEQQAYSTPAPIAFLASRLAGINGKTTVYEPTAGNGMLLMEAAPQNAIVNELNADRASRLKAQGFEVTEQDATGFEPAKNTDVVIENPPFGRVRENGNNETVEFDIDGFNTKELDQAIVVKSLQTLKDNGRAVLIIGGKQGNDAARKTKYRAASQIQFWKYLSDNYNIRDHFSIDGKMWTRQGAGYPVDVIVLDNQGRTENYTFPGGKPPRVYSSFEQLEDLLNEQQVDTGRVSPGDAVAGEGRDANRESDTASGASGRVSAEDVSGRDRPGSERGRESGRTDRDSQNNAASVAEQRTGELERTGRDSARSNGQETGSNRRDASGRTVAEQNNDVVGVERRDVSTETEDMGRSGGIHQDRSDQLGGNNRAGLVESQQERPKKEKPLKPTQYQTPYQKASALPSLGTLVPKNMATAVKNAFAAFKKEHGNIDNFVAKELGYNEAELGNHFAAEQVDAIGLAISNLKKDAGFIIGDQTGIGKGRVNAAIIRWAKRNGKVPVFITMNPQLYGDMVRDLQDIGMPGFNPLTTNVLTGSDAIELPDGRKLKTKASPKHKQLLQQVMQDGLGEDYDAIFTTYNQLDSSGDNFRRRFMEAIAPKALFILDEAHNAGGTQGQQRKAKDAAPSRAQFVRDLLKSSPNGVFYSSATYAKRPDVMDLYMKTDMRHAVNDGESLGEAINRGGIPMQQIVAAQLAQSGQYLRRERTWEGADVETHSVKTDTKRADACADAMRAIMEFDRAKQEALGKLQDQEAGAGLNVGDNSAANESGMSSIGFSSIMHNLISQSTLSQKVDAIVDACDTAIKNGEKPVITLSNTMGSAIEEYADVNKIAVGDPINITFEDMFMRYLEKTRTIVKTEGTGNRKKEIERRLLTDAELGPHAVALYNKAMDTIRKSGVNQLPVSFIDMIEEGLRKKGISTGEITGRKVGVDYSGAIPVLARKSNTTSDKINTVKSFNSGGLDAVILNSSGSTGISLHASEKFKDQRRRTMIVAQPDGNIDVFMQTLGRIFRTGQVVPPKYQLLFTDIPAEKRQAAVLAKKMASLNANTSAAKDSDASFKNIPDFMNKYGDRVAMQIIKDNPALHEKMGSPLDKKDNSKGTDSIDGSMQKLTGYIPLLPVKEQKVIYDQLEAAYKDLTEQLEAMGALDLEAKPIPFDAKLINEEEITPQKDVEGTNSPFTAAAKLGKYDVKKLGKPLPLEKVKEMVAEGNAIDPRDDRAAFDSWLKNKLKNISDKRRDDFRKRSEDNYDMLKALANTFKPGVPVLIENKVDGQKIAGVVTNVSKKGKADNPVALGNYHVEIAVADAAKKLTFPFSQIADPSATNYSFEPHGITRDEVYKAIEDGQSEGRESVYIATGNVLAAFERLEKGRVIVFEDHNGNLTPGLMLPKATSISDILDGLDVSLMPAQAMDFLKKCSTKFAMVKTEDKACAITRTGEDTFDMAVPASKAKGGQYFLNGAILKAAGKDFVKSGNSMVLRGLSGTKMQAVLDAMAGQNTGLIADNNKEVAREVSGQKQITTGSFADRKKQSDLETEIEDGAGIQINGRTVWNNPNASIRPGQFLSSRNTDAMGTKAAAVRNSVDALNRSAKNAANTEVVQGFTDLPQHLRHRYASNSTSLEAVYDPRTQKVWFVADNIENATRAAEVWAHEQIVHHGLRGMLSEGDRKRLLNSLWLNMGGMGNPLIRKIAETYGLKPTINMNDVQIVMEEVIANLAERRQANILTSQELTLWRKIVRAIARTWNKIIERTTGRNGRMSLEQVDQLLEALGGYVMNGVPAGVAQPAFFRAELAYPALRTKPAPQHTQIAYKLFRVDPKKPGRLFPLFVGANESVEMGVWHDAEIGQAAAGGKVKSKLGPLAMRPGWHAGDMPIATHIGGKSRSDLKAPDYRPENQVWAEVEVANDVDWQTEANNRAQKTKSGKAIARTAHITDQIPEDGMYRYKTNPNMTGTWIISGAMKVNRILSDVEVEAINKENGVADLPRQTPFNPEKYGFSIDSSPNASLNIKTNSYGIPMDRVTVIEGNITNEDLNNALRTLAGQQLENVLEGLTAEVNTRQRSKLVSQAARAKSVNNGFSNAEHRVAVSKIVNIWKWAAEAKGIGGKRIDNPDTTIRRFVSALKVNDKDCFAWLTLKETEGGLRIYSAELITKKELQDKSGNVVANKALTDATSWSEKIIDRLKGPVNDSNAPLASIGKDISEQVKSVFSSEAIAAGIRNLRKIAGRGVSDDVQDILDNPDMGKLVRKNDISFWERCFKVPHWIAKDHKEAAGIYDRQQQRTEERMAATNSDISKMSILFDQDKKNSLNDKEYKALAGMIRKWDGKEIAELKDVNKFRVKGKLPNGKSEYEINPDYRNKFKAWLDSQPEAQKVKSAFLQVREALDDAFIKAYTRMSKMEGIDPTELEKYRTEFGNIHNYFPHSRKGKYYVMATEGEGKDRKVVYRKHFDVPLGSSIREEWAKIVAEQQKNYPNAKWHNPGENEKLPDDILGAPIDPQAMEQIIKSAAGKIGDKQQAAEVSKLMLQGVADILKARGFGSHGIHRQNIAGYEMENVKEVLYDYFSGLNGWLTKMDAAADFTQMLGEIDARKQPRLWQYMSQYTKDMLRNSDNIDRVAGRIKTIAFAWYLGANMKTAIVNSTQNIIDGVPRLQQYITGGAGRWLKAAGDTIGMKYTGNGIKGARNLSAEEEKMLERLYGNGIISAAYMDELQGQLINSPVVKGWRKFVAVLGKPMGMVECFNRASLALAAYRAARAGAWRGYALKEFGLQPGQKMSAEQAEQFAAMLVRDSHFEYGKGNMPEIMRSTWAGRALSPMYTFRSFGANQLNLWYRALTKEGTEGKIFVAKSLGATIALGGLASFPFFATLSALCTALSGDDEDWQTKIKNQLPENDMVRDMVCYGLPAITGFSIAGSLRMETPFTDSFKKGKTFKDAMNDSIAGLIGIPYDLAVNRPNKYLEARKYGQDMKALEALAPTFVSNLIQAYRMNTQGQTGKTGAPIIDKATGKQNKFSIGEAIGKSFGFQPVSSARSYDDYQATQRAKEVRDDKLNELTMLFMKTLDGKGPQYRLKAIQEMRKWNEEMKDKPGMNINLKQIISRVNRRRPKQKKAS